MIKGLKGLAALALSAAMVGGLFVSGCQSNSAVNPIGTPIANGTSTTGNFGRLFVSTTAVAGGVAVGAPTTGTINANNADSVAVFGASSGANNTLIAGVLTTPETALLTGANTLQSNPVSVSATVGANNIIVGDNGNGVNGVVAGAETLAANTGSRILLYTNTSALSGATNTAPALVFIPLNLQGTQLTGVTSAIFDTVTNQFIVSNSDVVAGVQQADDGIFFYNLAVAGTAAATGAAGGSATAVAAAQLNVAITNAAMIQPAGLSEDQVNHRLFVASLGATAAGGGTHAALSIFNLNSINTIAGAVALTAANESDPGTNDNKFQLVADTSGTAAGLGNVAADQANDFTDVTFDSAHNQVTVANSSAGGTGGLYRFNNADVVSGDFAPDGGVFRAVANAQGTIIGALGTTLVAGAPVAVTNHLTNDGTNLYVSTVGSASIFRAGGYANQPGNAATQFGLIADPAVGAGGTITNAGLTGGAAATTAVTGISVDPTDPF